MSAIAVERKQLCDLASFAKQYQKDVISEWRQAYINYESMQPYLQFLKDIYDDYHINIRRNLEIKVEVLIVEPQVRKEIDKSLEFVQWRLQEGWERVQKFVDWKYASILYYWGQLIDMTIQQHFEEDQSHEVYDQKAHIKKLIKIIYAQTLCLKAFIELNLKIKKHCQQVQTDYADSLLAMDDSWNGSQTPGANRRRWTENADEDMKAKSQDLAEVEEGLRIFFYSSIYSSEYYNSNLDKYNIFSAETDSSKTNHFFVGLYLGLGIFIFIALCLVLILDVLEFDSDDDHINSMTLIFPMFRGIGLLILYVWGTAWNVYGFLQFKVNFRMILEYGSHYSNPFEIMKKAGFFTLLYCLMLFAYLIGLQYNRSQERNHLPIQYTPFFAWCIFLGYVFFPSKQFFNPQGRQYFYGLLKQMILSPIAKMGFVLSFATDQAVSFITPIKDFAYTVCFYGGSFTVNDVKNCLSSNSLDGVIIGYVIALIPLILRLIQCFRTARQASGKFFGHLQMWNFFKYVSSITTSTISFLSSSSLYPELFVPFVISSIVSTSYSYYWDLKYDWGLLEKDAKHNFLRKHLCYKRPWIYYTVMVVNLVMRCSWTLTISPSVIQRIPKSTFLPFVTGFIEIVRRCLWNFFRIEKQHVVNCKSFKVIQASPEDVMKMLRKILKKDAYQIDNVEQNVEYTKVTDIKFLDLLKSVPGYNLPRVEHLSIQSAYQIFKDCLQQGASDRSRLAKKQIKISLFKNMRKNYFLL